MISFSMIISAGSFGWSFFVFPFVSKVPATVIAGVIKRWSAPLPDSPQTRAGLVSPPEQRPHQ